MILIYRTGPITTAFFKESSETLDAFVSPSEPIIVAGDTLKDLITAQLFSDPIILRPHHLVELSSNSRSGWIPRHGSLMFRFTTIRSRNTSRGFFARPLAFFLPSLSIAQSQFDAGAIFELPTSGWTLLLHLCVGHPNGHP